MFDLKEFIEKCKAKPASVVKQLLEETLSDPSAVKAALDAEFAGRDISRRNLADMICFHSPTLTILKAAGPRKFKTPPQITTCGLCRHLRRTGEQHLLPAEWQRFGKGRWERRLI